MDRFHILTGGPGSGKSTLIDALEQVGYARSVEAGRGIIQQQVSIGGNALPWINPAAFADLMLTWEMRSYEIAQKTAGPVFFDRGVPDIAGYLQLNDLAIPSYVEKAIELYGYNRRVFIAPPWREIFSQDAERKQDFPEAVCTYEAMVSIYTKYGYQPVEIPQTTVEKRVEFVLSKIGEK
ncbi:MAG TPA: AAA family ATPase [Alloacidobacterium sp.]|nr:AAA family ATPase [Alloacidobacterium sp.]